MEANLQKKADFRSDSIGSYETENDISKNNENKGLEKEISQLYVEKWKIVSKIIICVTVAGVLITGSVLTAKLINKKMELESSKQKKEQQLSLGNLFIEFCKVSGIFVKTIGSKIISFL